MMTMIMTAKIYGCSSVPGAAVSVYRNHVVFQSPSEAGQQIRKGQEKEVVDDTSSEFKS